MPCLTTPQLIDALLAGPVAKSAVGQWQKIRAQHHFAENGHYIAVVDDQYLLREGPPPRFSTSCSHPGSPDMPVGMTPRAEAIRHNCAIRRTMAKQISHTGTTGQGFC